MVKIICMPNNYLKINLFMIYHRQMFNLHTYFINVEARGNIKMSHIV